MKSNKVGIWLYLHCFRYYTEQKNSDFSWWYCLNDGKIYQTSDLYELFGYNSKNDIYLSNNYVEFDKVDITELKKKYLKLKIGEREFKKWDIFNEKNFNLEFNRYIDASNCIIDWGEYEEKELIEAFINWRKKNHILLNDFNV